MDNKTLTLNNEQLAVIYFALVEQHNRLLNEKKDNSRHGSLARITDRQFEQTVNVLALIEKIINN